MFVSSKQIMLEAHVTETECAPLIFQSALAGRTIPLATYPDDTIRATDVMFLFMKSTSPFGARFSDESPLCQEFLNALASPC